ncbi:MAG: DUF4923 family protein [Paraprevotella sp.]|nr:DUF4923 family protein [Paraprevotella sp.]
MSLKLLMVGLSFAFTVNAQAQLGNLLKNVLGGSGSSTTTEQSGSSSTGSALSSVFQNLIGTAKVANSSLKGSWNYESPAVVFESSNLLKKAGGSLMTGAAENTLQKYLTKIGFKPGEVVLTFDGDKNFSMRVGSKTVEGNYTMTYNEITLHRSGLLKQPITANLSVKLKDMQITFKADKLLEFLTKISSMTQNSTLNLIGNVASGYDGMQLGLQFKKS